MTEYQKLTDCLSALRKQTDFVPKLALVLGSGLGGLADEVDCVASVSYSSLPGFPISTVEGHAGRFVFGFLEGVPVVVMQGRVHYYEGYDISDVVLPIRLMRLAGAEILFLTNAAGGINRGFAKGALMAIRDHFSPFVPSPLRGGNISEFGVRFPDMTEVYDRRLIALLHRAAEMQGTELFEGVYIQTPGPNYETPFEISVYEKMGADAVGMSTACEAIAAKHAGMRVCAISCITNLAAGISDAVLTHAEVKETADRVSADFRKLVKTSAALIWQSMSDK